MNFAPGTLMGDILIFLRDNFIGVCVIIGLFVEITPIKVSPISALMEFLLKSVRKEVKDMKEDLDKKMKVLEENQKTIENNQDSTRFATCRWEILTFASSLNNGQLYTEQEYIHIKDIIKEYDELCKKCDFKNGYTNDAVEKINTHYDQFKNSGTKYF